MATKEQRSVTIHDVFVNKLRSVHDLENNRLVQREWVASDEMFLVLKLSWNLCLNVALVARTVANFFFERIARATWMDDNCFQTDSPSHSKGSHLSFKRIAQAVQMDDNFFRTDSPSHSNGWQFFYERKPQGRSNGYQICSKTANRKECERSRYGTDKICSLCSLIVVFSSSLQM